MGGWVVRHVLCGISLFALFLLLSSEDEGEEEEEEEEEEEATG